MVLLRSLIAFIPLYLSVELFSALPLQAYPVIGDRALPDLTSQAPSVPKTADDWFYRGVKKGDEQDWQGAIADFSEAIRLNPNLIEAYNDRGTAYSILGENAKAIADFNEAIRLKPNDPEAYYNRGVTYRELKDYPNAIADFSQSIRLSPKDAVSYFNRGVIYQRLSDNQNAIADFQKAVDLFQQQGRTQEAKGIKAIIEQLQP
jgi:tetratricopeptide (TPR) repeat protein